MPNGTRVDQASNVRFPLSLRNVEELLFERGIDICRETVRLKAPSKTLRAIVYGRPGKGSIAAARGAALSTPAGEMRGEPEP